MCCYHILSYYTILYCYIILSMLYYNMYVCVCVFKRVPSSLPDGTPVWGKFHQLTV